jgi:hypothetical protein
MDEVKIPFSHYYSARERVSPSVYT